MTLMHMSRVKDLVLRSVYNIFFLAVVEMLTKGRVRHMLMTFMHKSHAKDLVLRSVYNINCLLCKFEEM